MLETGITLFWGATFTLGYIFLGYGMIIALVAVIFKRPIRKEQPAEWPAITLVLCACNEQERIAGRIDNLLDTDYPADKITVLIVSDGSTDNTNEIVANYGDVRVQLLALPERRGKPNGINQAMKQVQTDIVVYADARQRYLKNTLTELVMNLTDERVGAASGALMIVPSEGGAARGIDIYWVLEKFIRKQEGLLDSCVGCTGAIYAIRTKLYTPMPEDILIDDVYTPLNIVMQGYRVVHDPVPRALEPQSLATEYEKVRKPRTLAGNFQLMMRYPQWLLPWKNRIAFQLLCHKYLRLASPFLLLIQLIGALLLLPIGGVHVWPFILLAVFYGLAWKGLSRKNAPHRIIYMPGGFVFLNYAVLMGLKLYATGGYKSGWQMTGKRGK